MLMYGWMVFVEHAPERYDWAVRVMTFGQLDPDSCRHSLMLLRTGLPILIRTPSVM